MPFKTSNNPQLGLPSATGLQIGTPDDTAKVPVGTIAKFYDDTQGEGEFIYLPGVAATVAGDVVVYDLMPGAQATVRTLSGTHANSGRSVAVAMGATLATQFGWYQISGVAVVSVLAAFAAGARCWLTATAGNIDDTTIAGCQILGMFSSSAIATPSAGKAYCTLDRPRVQSQIT